ncbi:hypothetical protein P3L10_017565 [Capsicum annuum]
MNESSGAGNNDDDDQDLIDITLRELDKDDFRYGYSRKPLSKLPETILKTIQFENLF